LRSFRERRIVEEKGKKGTPNQIERRKSLRAFTQKEMNIDQPIRERLVVPSGKEEGKKSGPLVKVVSWAKLKVMRGETPGGVFSLTLRGRIYVGTDYRKQK